MSELSGARTAGRNPGEMDGQVAERHRRATGYSEDDTARRLDLFFISNGGGRPRAAGLNASALRSQTSRHGAERGGADQLGVRERREVIKYFITRRMAKEIGRAHV